MVCAVGALTFSCCRSIISIQGDARCKQAPPRGGNPTVATLHTAQKRRELSSQPLVSRLVLTDGSLLFIVQIQHERHNAGNGAQGSKDRQNHLRNMYRLPRKVFPRELPTSLHSAQHGMAGNRLLPHTVYKGGKNSTWTVGFHLKSIIQDSVDLSNKLGAKDRAAIL